MHSGSPWLLPLSRVDAQLALSQLSFRTELFGKGRGREKGFEGEELLVPWFKNEPTDFYSGLSSSTHSLFSSQHLIRYHVALSCPVSLVSSNLWWFLSLSFSFVFDTFKESTQTFCISLVQFSCSVWLFATPWTAACQASLSITNSWSLLVLVSIESVIPSSHLILSTPSPPAFNSGSFNVFSWLRLGM